MRFNADAKELHKVIDKAAIALPNRPVQAQTGMVKIEATFDGIYVTGTDTTFFVQAMFDGDVEVQGTVLVDPRDITVTTAYADDNDKATIEMKNRKIKLTCRGETDLNYMTDDGVIDFDSVSQGDETIIPLSDEELKALLVTSDPRSTLPMYSSLHVIAKDGTIRYLTVGGANSWFTYIEKPFDKEVSACIPLKYLVKAFKITSATRELILANNCIVETSDTCTVFPLNAFAPKDFKAWRSRMNLLTTVTPDFKLFLEAVQRGGHYTGPQGAVLLTTTATQLAIQTVNGSETKIPVPAMFDGPGIDIAFNSKIMIDSLKSVGEGARIELFEIEGKESKVLGVTNDSFNHILMPMAIKRSF